ncbi:hypothetical protein EON65_27880 [archaeon]|nr:MAG: hypothetical protein EON65_27880 [archaeon]
MEAPPQPSKEDDYPYGVLLVGTPSGDWQGAMQNLLEEIERSTMNAGVRMRKGESDVSPCSSTHLPLTRKLYHSFPTYQPSSFQTLWILYINLPSFHQLPTPSLPSPKCPSSRPSCRSSSRKCASCSCSW